MTHHFLPHQFPVSSFLLNYARGTTARCSSPFIKCCPHVLLFNMALFHSVSTHPDSGECPVTSFECLGGRCLPLSWRCNGRVECLDEGAGIGTDEQGCDETTEPTKFGSTEEEEDKAEPNNDHDRDSDGQKAGDKRPERDPLWELLNDREQEEAQVDREQLQTHRGLVVTPTPIEWPCGGLHQTFYGTFSPPAIRGPPLFCVWTLDPQDSRPLRLDLQQLVLGPGDRLTVYNREQGKGDIIKIVSF